MDKTKITFNIQLDWDHLKRIGPVLVLILITQLVNHPTTDIYEIQMIINDIKAELINLIHLIHSTTFFIIYFI